MCSWFPCTSTQCFMPSFVECCSPPARWGLLDFIRAVLLILLLLQFLLDHVCINFHVHFRLANSLPISSPTSARSGHCWTSTAGFRSEWARLDLNRQVLSAVGTAGPQPGTFRAQWAMLDPNLRPSELSGHRWTSTWDLPSSVGTAGLQRPDRMPEDMPDRTPDKMSDRMPEDMPECLPDRMSEDMPEHIAEDMPGRMPEDMPDRMPEDRPDKMPEDMSDRMPEDLPVTKRINVMVGITRRKVFFACKSQQARCQPMELQTKVHGPTWMHGGAPQPSTPAAIDLSKLCEPRSHLWAQHCSAIGCPSWIWCNRTHDRATWIRCGRPWVRSFMERPWPPPGHHEQGGHDQAMTNGTTTNGIGDPAMDKDHPGPEWVATSYSDHAKGRLQCVGKWKKVSSFLTSGVSKLPQHLLHVRCFESTNFSTHCFWHATWIASIFGTQCFWLSTHCFSYMQAMHASWTCCFWHSMQCFWHDIFASNLLLCTNFSSSEMQSHHGQWAEWMAFAWKPKADFHVVHTTKSNGFVLCCCQDNHYSHHMQKFMHHILARIIIIAITCRKSRTILMRFVILFSFFNKFMFPPKHYMLKDSIERNWTLADA